MDLVVTQDHEPVALSSRLPRLGPPALIMVMLVVALALNLPVLLSGDGAPNLPAIPLPALVAVFVAFEFVVLHVPLGKDLDHAETLNLTELVLVLGLLLAPPSHVIVATTGAVLLVNFVRRTQNSLKQAFNATSRFLSVGVAIAVYQALVPSGAFSLGGWGAVTAAALASSLISATVVTLVLRLVVGPIAPRDVASSILGPLPLSVACAAVGFVAAQALRGGDAGVVPLLIALASLLLVMRTTTVLAERHLHLVALHDFSQRVSATHDTLSLVSAALDTASDLLVAREAVAYLDADGEAPASRFTRDPDGGVREAPVPRSEVSTRRGLVSGLGRDRLVSSSSLAGEGEIVLVASSRATGLRRFRREDARILDMVAQRAASDLRTLRLIEKLRFDALHDPLTGLPNRRSITEAARNSASDTGDVGAVWLGLGGLQKVNEALGHDLGDELLVQVGERLARASGASGEVSRVGGDEFAVLFSELPAAAPTDLANSLLAALERPFMLSRAPVLLRARAGVAFARSDTTASRDDLLRRADIAMREAHRSGRAVEEYTSDMETSTPELLTLASELQLGIAERQLVLHAQPQVRLRDGVTTGVEMLVRWNHPQRGLLHPLEFLPLAASTGLERPLTAWVLEEATAALARWRREGLDLTVAVNIVPSLLTDGSLHRLVGSLLERHETSGENLVLEVVESGLITRPEMAAEVLTGIAALGPRISIDDFGTGFSSLSHLRRLPVNEIKIDRSFVTTMLNDQDDSAIVRSVIRMGRGLGLTVVAEGVESQDVYGVLKALGCGSAQGFHMARPMPLDQVGDWMRDDSVNGR